jgi:hypothetical protein
LDSGGFGGVRVEEGILLVMQIGSIVWRVLGRYWELEKVCGCGYVVIGAVTLFFVNVRVERVSGVFVAGTVGS